MNIDEVSRDLLLEISTYLVRLDLSKDSWSGGEEVTGKRVLDRYRVSVYLLICSPTLKDPPRLRLATSNLSPQRFLDDSPTVQFLSIHNPYPPLRDPFDVPFQIVEGVDKFVSPASPHRVSDDNEYQGPYSTPVSRRGRGIPPSV